MQNSTGPGGDPPKIGGSGAGGEDAGASALPECRPAAIAALSIEGRRLHETLGSSGTSIDCRGNRRAGPWRFSYTTEKKVIDLGPITASVDEKHNIDIPDVAGIGAILVGGLLLFLGRKNA